MSRTLPGGVGVGVILGILAGAAAYGFQLWNLAQRNPVLCNPGYAGEIPLLLSIPTFVLIAAAAGYVTGEASLRQALTAGVVVGIIAAIGNLATTPLIHDQLVRFYQCPFASDPTVSGASLADVENTTIVTMVIGSAIGLFLAPGAAAAGRAIKRTRLRQNPAN